MFLTGSDELRFVRRSAAALAQRMPNGVDGIAIGMHHDWPLRHPDLFSRTVDGWLSGTALPPEIELPTKVVAVSTDMENCPPADMKVPAGGHESAQTYLMLPGAPALWRPLLWFRCRCLVESKPAGETYLKSDGELMEILNAYDLTGSYRAAGELCGCSHHTVKKAVDDRDAGSAASGSAGPDDR